MSGTPLIDFQKVSYWYPRADGGKSERPALCSLNLRVQSGEYLAILGHNGSGKSTLARHCNALLTPGRGHVLVAGMDTRAPAFAGRIRETVGMIFQQPDNQIIATIVEDDVAWALSVRGFPAEQIAERVTSALEAVGLAHLRKQSPQRLSGGQRQRLAIAGILALRPRCIIADEATSQLDPLSRQEIVRLLHDLHREYGLTIIHVTHLLEEVTEAERILVMEQGHILLEGTPATVFADLDLLRSLRLIVPDALELAARLRAGGIPIAPTALTESAIVEELLS